MSLSLTPSLPFNLLLSFLFLPLSHTIISCHYFFFSLVLFHFFILSFSQLFSLCLNEFLYLIILSLYLSHISFSFSDSSPPLPSFHYSISFSSLQAWCFCFGKRISSGDDIVQNLCCECLVSDLERSCAFLAHMPI